MPKTTKHIFQGSSLYDSKSEEDETGPKQKPKLAVSRVKGDRSGASSEAPFT